MPVVGTCSICGGAVMVPEAWGGVIPPTPTCSRCKAVARHPYGPVMLMEQAAPFQQERVAEQVAAKQWRWKEKT